MLGAQAFIARKALGQARGLALQKLEKTYHRLLAIDASAKTGRTPVEVSRDLLVPELKG